MTEEVKTETPAPQIDVREVENKARDAERARIATLTAMGEKVGDTELAKRYIHEGKTADDFSRAYIESLSNKPTASPNEVGMSAKEERSWSLMRAVNAVKSNDWSKAGLEREASDAIAKQLGREARGFFIPSDVKGWGRRDLTVGTDTAGGHLKGVDHLGMSFVEALYSRLIVKQLGAQVLSGLVGDISIPALDAKTTTYWVAENSAPTEGAPTFREITMSPKTVASYVDMSRLLMRQSSPSVENVIRNDLLRGTAVAVDKAAINGDMVSANDEPTGILQTSGIGDVSLGASGGAPTWAGIVNLIKEVQVDDADINTCSFLTNPAAVAKMRQTSRQTSGIEGNFIMGEAMNLLGYNVAVSNVVPSNLEDNTSATGSLSALLFGDFSQLLIGEWGGMDVFVDPYSLSKQGATRITCFCDMDVAVRHAQSFAAIQDMDVS